MNYFLFQKLGRLITTEGDENRQVRLFDLNTAIIDAVRGMNTYEPFTYQQNNMTYVKGFLNLVLFKLLIYNKRNKCSLVRI